MGILLLLFLWSLVEVHSETAPYVIFTAGILPNHSYVDLHLVGGNTGSDPVVCKTDMQTCCNSGAGPDRGDWYFPNGDRLQFPGNLPLVESRLVQRVELYRQAKNGSIPSGIYRCDIETRAVNSADNTARETVYVGLYASGGDATNISCTMHLTNYKITLAYYVHCM